MISDRNRAIFTPSICKRGGDDLALLYQFAGSHYCEKARWALDYKGVRYATVNLIPGPHWKTAKRIAGHSSVPFFVDDDQHVVQGSAEII